MKSLLIYTDVSEWEFGSIILIRQISSSVTVHTEQSISNLDGFTMIQSYFKFKIEVLELQVFEFQEQQLNAGIKML